MFHHENGSLGDGRNRKEVVALRCDEIVDVDRQMTAFVGRMTVTFMAVLTTVVRIGIA